MKVTDSTIVVDARKRFDYQMAHYPGAIHLRWESFVNSRARYPGRLIEEKKKLIQFLALKGLHPSKKVIVVGEGARGDASAGRLAWTLFHLGLSNIQVVGSSSLGLSSNVQQDNKYENAKAWSVPDNSAMTATKEDVLAVVTAKPKGNKRTAIILDVRSQDEYFKKKGFGRKYALPDLGALNVEWKEFYTRDGKPNLQLRNRLSAIGVTPDMKVVLISDNGIRAAAAHFALAAMGYSKSQVFLDGYKGLL
ncbi:MAG: rhodanese-like domain-containing protein [Pseudomonadota bacterium]